ncbi:MAG: zf-HC2 domain-containing protein, partial [Terriglobia bacterium]
MSCFDELTYSQWVDGELPLEQARRVREHIASCVGCRALVEALRGESALLTDVLIEDAPEAQAVPAPAGARRARPLDLVWTAAVVLAAAAGLQGLVNSVSGFEAPAGTSWLNPFSLSVQLRVFFDSVFYFTEEGVGMLTSTLAAISGLVLVLLLGAATLIYARRRPRAVALLATLAFALLLALPSAAIERRKARTVTVAADETLDDSLVAFGDTVLIEGVITGNLIAFAHNISINGTIQGDAIIGGQRMEVKGKVGGNVIAFGEQVRVEGEVAQSVITFAQALAIEAGGVVKGDVLVFAAELNMNGAVERDVTAATAQTYVRGSIGRNLALKCDRVTLLKTARVGGDVTVRVKDEKRLHVDPGAIIGGELKTELSKPKRSRFTRARFYFWQGVSLVGAFLTGLLLYWLFPALFTTRL